MHSTWFSSTFLKFLKFRQIKERGLNFFGGTNSAERMNYLIHLLYLNFRSLKDSNSLSFIRFQCFLHDSVVLFSAFLNFVKLKRGDLISPGDPILQNGRIIWSPLLYFNFRNFKDPNSLHSLDLNAFYIIHQHFSQVFEISLN